jgi:hypothetical protein
MSLGLSELGKRWNATTQEFRAFLASFYYSTPRVCKSHAGRDWEDLPNGLKRYLQQKAARSVIPDEFIQHNRGTL